MPPKAKTATKKKRSGPKSTNVSRPKCGLCGKTSRLIKTECCGQWICDDEHEYVMFSYARNSCSRNHRRYTLCGYHFAEQHDGPWQTCPRCREEIEAEMYGYFGTNEFNFERLEKVPEFEPKRCVECDTIIRLVEGGYSRSGSDYHCAKCTAKRFPRTR